MKTALFWTVVALIIAGGFILWITPAPTPVPVPQLSGKTGRLGPADIYPPVPGAINTSITQANIGQNICNKGWSTKSERPPSSYTTTLKKKQMQQWHLAGQTKDYEEDHLISLELGGNPTDPTNLWPEPYRASIPDGGAKIKDSVENFLHTEVCSGEITLASAQHAIVTDWYAVYKTSLSGKYGSVDTFDGDDQ